MENKTHKCLCSKVFAYLPGLCKHRKNCEIYLKAQTNVTDNIPLKPPSTLNDMELHYTRLLETQELHYKKQLEEQEQRYKKHLEEQEQRSKKILEEMEQRYKKHLEEQEQRSKKILEELEQRYKQQLEEQEQKSKIQSPIAQPVVNAAVNPIQPVVQHLVKPSIKDYLKSLKPISIDTFMINYIPKLEDFNNILNTGTVNGIISNFTSYLETYNKEQYPIVVSNRQNARLRIYVYTTDWTIYDCNKAYKYLSNIVIRFVNKYFKNIHVFNDAYSGCVIDSPSLHPDKEDHLNKKLF